MTKFEGVLAISVVLVLAISVCTQMQNGESAQKNARNWARDLGMDVEHIVCNELDTDQDGYVSCAFSVKGEIKTFECAGYGLNGGCREPKAKLQINNQINK